MPKVQLRIPVYLPEWLYTSLRKVKRVLRPPPKAPIRPNIQGERHIEWTFITSRMPQGPGEALDFGCEYGYLSLLMAQKGFRVVALDLQPQKFFWQNPNVRFVQGDILQIDLPENHFDLLINCSTVEHVGLAGRYGIERLGEDDDLRAMGRLRGLLKPGGTTLFTIPCGRDAVFAPLHRVYGAQRLPRLLEGFTIQEEAFWVKDSENRWNSCDKQTALNFLPYGHESDPFQSAYALGGFVLTKRA